MILMKGGCVELIMDGEARKGTMILAHGAGMAMDHPYMEQLSLIYQRVGFKVVRFEFPYMSERRKTGKKRPPDKLPVLIDRFKEVFAAVSLTDDVKLLAGKSMGGRIATMIAEELSISLVFILGYPFHPIGKPEKLRTEHLKKMAVPTIIFQGERDKLGNQSEVSGYELSDCVRIHWFEDGDHDLKPRVRSGFTQEQHLEKLTNFVKLYC